VKRVIHVSDNKQNRHYILGFRKERTLMCASMLGTIMLDSAV